MTLYSKWTLEHSIIFICSIIMAIIILSGDWSAGSKAVREKTNDYYNSKQIMLNDMENISQICREEGLSFQEYLAKYYSEEGTYYWNELETANKLYRGYRVQQWRYLLLFTLIFPFLNLFLNHYKKNICCISLLVAAILSVISLIFCWGSFNMRIWIFLVLAVFTLLAAAMSDGFHTEGKGRFCPYCGCLTGVGDKFCQNCGKNL